MSEPHGQTTLPIASTGLRGESSNGLAIRWIFPDVTGRLTVFDRARALIGRGPECDIVLPGGETSRQHAEIRREGPLVIIRDLGSRNGVSIRGHAEREASLAVSDVLRLGEWIGIVVRHPAPDEVTYAYAPYGPGLFAGPALQRTLAFASTAARSNLPIILQGETGTGKEGAARAIHDWSGRQGPFVAVNCAALPESLAEAELFGYRRGAFTGADKASLGYFRAAHQGTLFLDEVVDLPITIQAKLLRVIERNEVTPIGEATTVPIDVRVVAAAQGPLQQAVDERRFRADLFARLDGVTVVLPALRERIEDLPYVFMQLLSEHGGGHPPSVEARLVERLCLYDWPYNMRELDLLVRRLLLHEGGALRKGMLPARFLQTLAASDSSQPSSSAPPSERPQDREERELGALLTALRVSRGNVAQAAASVGVSRQRAYRLMGNRPEVDLTALRAPDQDARGKPR